MQLIHSQSDVGLDGHRLPGRKVARSHRDASEDENDDAERDRVGRRHAVENRPDDLRRAERAREPQRDARPGKPQPLSKNQSQNVAAGGAERDPQADLLRALRN